jgi:hypothetical protein
MDEYLYLDKEGIDSLYAQRSEMVKESVRESAEKSGKVSGSINPKVQIGNLLALLGLGKIEIQSTAALDRQSKKASETTYSIQSENKLPAILEHLNEASLLYDSVESALADGTSGKRTFCVFAESLILADWNAQAPDQWRKKANKEGMLVFHLKDNAGVTMGMSLSKTTMHGVINLTSHFAISARGSDGLFTFKVFGAMQRGYIKPYSVSRR